MTLVNKINLWEGYVCIILQKKLQNVRKESEIPDFSKISISSTRKIHIFQKSTFCNLYEKLFIEVN